MHRDLMQRRLSREEGRKRYSEGIALWNEFDPIGVFPSVQDEYDGYIGPCLRLVEVGDGEAKIAEYVKWAVFENMGLNPTEELEDAIVLFAKQFTEWYREKWPGTVV
jgi:hypothetical protein